MLLLFRLLPSTWISRIYVTKYDRIRPSVGISRMRVTNMLEQGLPKQSYSFSSFSPLLVKCGCISFSLTQVLSFLIRFPHFFRFFLGRCSCIPFRLSCAIFFCPTFQLILPHFFSISCLSCISLLSEAFSSTFSYPLGRCHSIFFLSLNYVFSFLFFPSHSNFFFFLFSSDVAVSSLCIAFSGSFSSIFVLYWSASFFASPNYSTVPLTHHFPRFLLDRAFLVVDVAVPDWRGVVALHAAECAVCTRQRYWKRVGCHGHVSTPVCLVSE